LKGWQFVSQTPKHGGFDLLTKSKTMANFCKNGDCPTSQELLAFQNGDISVADGKWIRIHLVGCEFCTAEADFYDRYPQGDEQSDSVESPEMPAPLYELAQALIGKRRDIANFERLVSEINSDNNQI